MYFTAETLAANSRLRGTGMSFGQTATSGTQHDMMVNAYRSSMTPEMLAANAVGGFAREFWAELDRQVIQMRDQEIGMEIVNDLMAVQTILPIGKTAKLYNVSGDIADDVSISIDGQAPYSFDHTDYGSDGDPIPVFTAGYGVNWRHAAGLSTVGIDMLLDAQGAKMRKFHKRRVNYYLNGDASISVDGYKARHEKSPQHDQDQSWKRCGWCKYRPYHCNTGASVGVLWPNWCIWHQRSS